MKKIVLATFSVCLSFYTYAQNEQDVLRYSQNKIFGSARVLGAGGAFGALGSDLSAIAINPAGIGLYRRSETAGSLAISAYFNDNRYIESTTFESKTALNIPQIGFVFNKMQQGFKGDETEGLVSYSFAFGINRLNDFNQNNIFTGVNTKSSIADYFAELANGKTFPGSNPYSFYNNNIPGMAWNTYLIDSAAPLKYASTFESKNDTNFSIQQSGISKVSGNINEYNFSSGLNVSNMFYFGASLLIQNVNYESNSEFKESVLTSSRSNNLYQGSNFTSILKTSGSGIGGRFGFIFKPFDYFRCGVSYTTAVRLNLKDEYSYGLNSQIKGINTYVFSENERTDSWEYDIVTPSKLTLSTSFIFKKLGFISIDWDQVDYSSARITSQKELFINANKNVSELYKKAYNLRIGSELKYKDTRFRLGYANYGSPFKDNSLGVSLNNPTQTLTSGLGFIFPTIDNYGTDFFIDGALAYSWVKNYNTPYQLENKGKTSYTVENNFSMINVIITAGLRF